MRRFKWVHRMRSECYAKQKVIYMTGWAPADGQQNPAARGSATVSLEDLEDFLKKNK